jgi:hypothetical protein
LRAIRSKPQQASTLLNVLKRTREYFRQWSLRIFFSCTAVAAAIAGAEYYGDLLEGA